MLNCRHSLISYIVTVVVLQSLLLLIQVLCCSLIPSDLLRLSFCITNAVVFSQFCACLSSHELTVTCLHISLIGASTICLLWASLTQTADLARPYLRRFAVQGSDLVQTMCDYTYLKNLYSANIVN